MRFTVLVIVVMVLLAVPAACRAAEPDADGSVSFNDAFDGKQLNEKVWLKGGSRKLHTVRDGSLRLVALAKQEHASVATRRGDFNFFNKPVTVVWDLVPHRILAGPFPATKWSKAYAGLTIGGVNKGTPAAELGLTAWPEGFPAPKAGAEWFHTLNLGRLMPQHPAKNYGKDWFKDWRITGVPQRIIWSLDKTSWSVEIKGARFVTGDPHKRSGRHALKEKDFHDSGFHLKIYVSSHVQPMERGVNHIGGVLYTNRICVTSPDAVPPYTEEGHRDTPTLQGVLEELLGKNFPEKAQPAKPQYLFGVNYVGGGFRPRQGFLVPTTESLDYYKSKGVLLMRLPITWEPLQPKLEGQLDERYVSAVKRSVRLMGERDMKVLLDLHNYARYRKKLIGSAEVPFSAFADVWRRLAEAFKDEPAIWGYGLMNEPYNTEGKWPEAAQAGIDGVRAVDKKTMIVVCGDQFGNTMHWMKYGAPLAKQLKDPSNNLCWEGHCYFDSYSGGKYQFSYEYEINRPDTDRWPCGRVDPMFGVRVLEPFVKWLKANNYKGIVGEFGVPANPDRDPRWLVILDNVYAYLAKNGIPNTYWAAGTMWTPGRSYIIEPEWRAGPNQGKDRPQMRILLKHARESQK